MKVQVLDAEGKPVEGYSFGDATAVTKDGVAQLVSWKKGLVELAGKTVKLEFELKNATLYAVEMFGSAREAVEGTMPATRWEDTIQKLEQRLAKEQPQKGAVLFAGSSTIVGWDLPKFFPGIKTIKCGFGGSFMRDSTYYAGRLIVPFAPKIVVAYAGDNDIAQGLSAEDVAADFEEFAEKVHAALPETRIVFLSIKPSLARWEKWPAMDQANKLIAELSRKQKLVEFVDMTGVTLGPDGKPRPEFFQKDGLHLNANGYQAWSEILATRLEAE